MEMEGVYESVHALSMSGTVPPDFVRSVQEEPAAGGSADAFAPRLPVIDMSMPPDECAALMAAAAAEWGLFHVVNHGVPAAASSELQRVGRAFFASSPQGNGRTRNPGAAAASRSRNIEGYGSGITCARGSTAKNPEGKKNWEDYLFHYVAPPAAVDHAVWPKNPAGYREASEEYCRHMLRLTRQLLGHLSLGLGLEETAMGEAFGGDQLELLHKVNYYPPCPQPELALGLGPHTDMCVANVLLTDDVEGLQVLKDGRWHDVKHVPDALIVLVSDQMEIFSNGMYKAVKHRAKVNKDKTRMSWATLVEPPGDLVVGPHPQLTAGDSPPAKYKPQKYRDYQFSKTNLVLK